MEDKLVTVAIPAYKACFLREAIDSVLNQDYKNIELIVVNDQSPENISEIVQSYSDKRIRYYVNEHNIGGKDLVASWDRCLYYATGEYFCLLCDDDVYKPTFISSLVTLANIYPDCNVFRARCEIIDKNERVVELYASCPSWETCYDYMYHVFRGFRKQTVSEFLYRTNHIKRIGGYIHFPLAWQSDYWSVFSFSKDDGIASSNHVLVSFRMSGDNISSKKNKYGIQKATANIMAYQKALELICDSGDMKNLLLSSLEVWKYRTDKELITSLSFCEIIKLMHNYSGLRISRRALLLGIISSMFKKA